MKGIHSKLDIKNNFSPMAQSSCGLLVPARAVGKWHIDVYDKNGKKYFEDEWENLVTTVGKNYLIDSALANQTAAITAWYLMLISATPTVAAGDTAASHAGWTEVTAYSQATRQAWTANGATASGSNTNSSAQASFTINADGTSMGGAALISNSTKGGTTGTLYSAGAFTGGNVTLSSGSTVAVTATFSVT